VSLLTTMRSPKEKKSLVPCRPSDVCVVRHPTALYAFFQVRKPNVRNGGSLAPVGFDGGNSRSWWAATGFRSVKTEEKKTPPAAPSMFHGQSGPRSDFFFGSCCLLSHGRPWLSLPLRVASPLFLSSTTDVVQTKLCFRSKLASTWRFVFIREFSPFQVWYNIRFHLLFYLTGFVLFLLLDQTLEEM
jgi:hypothetical protein